jgi:hypothetical protein
MAVQRALMFRAGTKGLICAAFEVAIERGSEDREGTIRLVRECPNPATVEWQGTGLCADCAELLQHAEISVVRNIKRGDAMP